LGYITRVRLPSHVAVRQAKAAEEYLAQLGLSPKITLEYYEQGSDPHWAQAQA